MDYGDGNRNNLDVGDKIYTTLGGTKRIDSIEFISGDVEVIHFDVEPLDVYFMWCIATQRNGF